MLNIFILRLDLTSCREKLKHRTRVGAVDFRAYWSVEKHTHANHDQVSGTFHTSACCCRFASTFPAYLFRFPGISFQNNMLGPWQHYTPANFLWHLELSYCVSCGRICGEERAACVFFDHERADFCRLLYILQPLNRSLDWRFMYTLYSL